MAPQPKLATRTPTYLSQYGRTLNAAYRYERIKQEIRSEQDRVQYLDSLIGQERQTLAGLQQVFRADPLSLEAAQELLKGVTEVERELLLREAQGAAAVKAATTMTKTDRAKLERAFERNREEGVREAELMIKGATPAKAKAIIAALPGAATAQDKAGLQAFAAENAKGKPPKGKEAAGTKEAQAVAGALEAVYFAGPTGIRGGYDGLAVVNRRKLTADQLEKQDAAAAKALRESGFATQQDALDEALKSVRETGDPNAVENAYARDLYVEARNTQAYTNAERADFEQEVLDSRKRVAQLEAERLSLKSRYSDPAQEAIKRELTARGYSFADEGSEDSWKNRYIQYQNTPLYDTLLAADRLVDTAKRDATPLTPSTKAQNTVTTLAMQYDRTGTKFDLDTLRTQLEKANDLSDKDVDDAMSFIIAYRELGGEKQDPKQLEFLRQQQEAQLESDRVARERAVSMQAAVAQARQDAESVAQRVATTPSAPAKPDQDALFAARLAGRRVAPATLPQVPDEELVFGGGVIKGETPAAAPPAAAPPAAAPPAAPSAPGRFYEEGTPYSYQPTSTGDFIVFRDDVPLPEPVKGSSRAGQSIARVVAGQSPLPPAAPSAPAPARARTPAPAPATPAPARTPAPTAAPKPLPKPKSEAEQLKKMLTDGTLKRGTEQFDAALDRLDELEGR